MLAAWKHTWQITRRLARWWQQIIEIQVQQIISQTIIGVGRNCFLCLLPPSIRNFFNGHMNVSRMKSLLGSSSWHCWSVRANSISHVIFYLNIKSRFHVALEWLCKQRIAPLSKCLQMVNLSWFYLQIVVNLILLWPTITLIPLVIKPLDP